MHISNDIPKPGLKGAKENFKNDFTAAISVALVALPLGLGIAFASDVPPIAGILSAIIGGLIATFFRSGHVSINGPAAGLIIVVATGVQSLGSYEYVLAAFVVSGLIMFLMGLLRFGKIADYLPISVVQGILAAIGLIIIAKQLHVAFGSTNSSSTAIDSFSALPESFINLNPAVTLIAILAISFLMLYPRIDNKILKSLPSALWVLIITVPFGFLINYLGEGKELLNFPLEIAREYKINIPEDLTKSFVFPDFSKIASTEFWILVLGVTIIGSIESLVSVKAVDKLDEYRRKTNINKDLYAVGLSTIVSALIGGLPVLTVIIRSSVNINHNAKTKYSNFYHAIILLGLVALIPGVIREVPKAALASILIFTGFRLASPRVFKNCYNKGWEQLLIFSATMIITLFNDLLWGLAGGIITTFLVHYGRTGLNFKTFLKHLKDPYINIFNEKDGKIHVAIKGVINFLNLYLLIRHLNKIDEKEKIILDFAHTKLIDSTALEFIQDFKRSRQNDDPKVELIGLDNHKTSSEHPNALHVFHKPQRYYFTSRQLELEKFSNENAYTYFPDIRWENPKLKRFRVFNHTIIEYTYNNIKGTFKNGVDFRYYDVAYNSGIILGSEVHKLSLVKLKFDFEICTFSLHKENLVDTISDWISSKEIKSKKLERLFDKYSIEYNDFNKLDEFFNVELANYILQNPLNIESYKNEVILFKKMRLLSPDEIFSLHNHAQIISDLILKNNKI